MKILIFGLPGAGKTYLANKMQEVLGCAWYNADKVREMANDWDFTPTGRKRQAERMFNIAKFEKENGRTVICDFVCPTKETREQFSPDYSIWMNTIERGRFEDTNQMFETPSYADCIVEKFLTDDEILKLVEDMKDDFLI